jgi:hypothetical protein
MLQKLFTAVGRLYSFLMSLIVALLLGAATWACWQFYQDTQLQTEFVKEGTLITLRVNQAEQKQRSWRDILSHSTYLTLNYQGKDYTTRYVMDSTFVGEGDRVQLLYHPGYDAFRQPGNEIRFDQSKRKSRLIDWTTIREFSNQNRLLLLCLLLSTASFFFISGVIITIIPIPFLSDIARFVFVAELAIAAGFFTYDTWAYYTYYQDLKANGRDVVVTVLDTRRIAHGRRSRMRWYDYQATIRYQQQERVIPISKDDFTALKPADSLHTLYAESVDDLMAVDYAPDYSLVVVPMFLWLLTFIIIRPSVVRKEKTGVLNT